MSDFFNSFTTNRGRINRQRFLVYSLLLIGMGIVGGMLDPVGWRNGGEDGGLVMIFALLFTTAAHVMLMIRRAHDLDRSGWLVLLAVIPLVNIVFTLFMVFMKGSAGDNRFGPDPLGVDAGSYGAA